jgi:hypothetical protein
LKILKKKFYSHFVENPSKKKHANCRHAPFAGVGTGADGGRVARPDSGAKLPQ